MVGKSAEGCSVNKTKWQCGLGSSKDLRKAFSAASFMASAGAIIKKRSEVSLLFVRAINSRICSTVITGVCLSSAGVSVRAFGSLSFV